MYCAIAWLIWGSENTEDPEDPEKAEDPVTCFVIGTEERDCEGEGEGERLKLPFTFPLTLIPAEDAKDCNIEGVK